MRVLCCGRDEELVKVFVARIQVRFVDESHVRTQLLCEVGFDSISTVISVKIEVNLANAHIPNFLDCPCLQA